jgi:hypothetical protein
VNLDAGALHPLLIGHLPNVCVNLVDRQTWAAFQVSTVLNLNGPLVASGKLDVV